MSENDSDPETEADESTDEANSPVIETVKESDGDTETPSETGEDDPPTGDGGDIDGA